MTDRCRKGQEECVWKKINTQVLSYKEKKPPKSKNWEEMKKHWGLWPDALKYLEYILRQG